MDHYLADCQKAIGAVARTVACAPTKSLTSVLSVNRHLSDSSISIRNNNLSPIVTKAATASEAIAAAIAGQ